MTTSTDEPPTSTRRSLVHLFSGGSVQAVAGLLTGLVATRLLAPGERGVMVVATTVAGVVALLGTLSMGTGLRAILPTAAADDRPELVRAYWRTSILGTIVATALAPVATLASAGLIDAQLRSPSVLVGVAVVTMALAFTPQVTEAYYAIGDFKAAAGWAAAAAAGGLAGISVGAAIDRSAGVLLAAQGIGTLLPALGGCARLRRAAMLDLGRPARGTTRRLLAVGMPALGAVVGVNVILRGDRYLLGIFEPTSTVAVYALAATLAESFRIIPLSLGQLLYRRVSLHDGSRIKASVYVIPFVATAISGVAVAGAGWLLITPIFGSAFSGARTLLLLLVVAEVAFAPFFIATGGLLGGGWTRAAGAIGLVGGLLTVVLYTAGVAAFGAWGAAIASLIAYGAMSVAATLVLRRQLGRVGRGPSTDGAARDD